jgi:hypothetical protein
MALTISRDIASISFLSPPVAVVDVRRAATVYVYLCNCLSGPFAGAGRLLDESIGLPAFSSRA